MKSLQKSTRRLRPGVALRLHYPPSLFLPTYKGLMPSDQAAPRRALVLFCGTGSIDRAFQRLGWQVVSVDACAKYAPTHVADVHMWDHTQYPPGYFDFCWGSPPCTQFSRARTHGKPRDLVGACATVARTLEIFAYFGCPWALENPSTGLLKHQAVVQGLPWRDVTYCKYGALWRKGTRIWNTLGDAWRPSTPCCKASPCAHFAARRHPMCAEQDGRPGKEHYGFATTRDQIYAIPEALCDEIALAAAQRAMEREVADDR